MLTPVAALPATTEICQSCSGETRKKLEKALFLLMKIASIPQKIQRRDLGAGEGNRHRGLLHRHACLWRDK
jgi:hypothetical protein